MSINAPREPARGMGLLFCTARQMGFDDGHGMLLAIGVTAGRRHEGRGFAEMPRPPTAATRPVSPAAPGRGFLGPQLQAGTAVAPAAPHRTGDPDAEGLAARRWAR
jgi:hypothetical protein